jgi:hypothetical protein
MQQGTYKISYTARNVPDPGTSPGTAEFDMAVADVMERYSISFAPYATITKDTVYVELSKRGNLKETRSLLGRLGASENRWVWSLTYSQPWFAHRVKVYGAAAEIALNLPGLRQSACLPLNEGSVVSTMNVCAVCGSYVDYVAINHRWTVRCGCP